MSIQDKVFALLMITRGLSWEEVMAQSGLTEAQTKNALNRLGSSGKAECRIGRTSIEKLWFRLDR